jgi:hypothetical protein
VSFDYTIHGKYCNNAIEIDCEIGGVRAAESIEILDVREVRLMQPCRNGDLDTITLSNNDMHSDDERYWTAVAQRMIAETPEYRVRESVEVSTAQRRSEFDPIADRRGNWPVDKSVKQDCGRSRCGRCAAEAVAARYGV